MSMGETFSWSRATGIRAFRALDATIACVEREASVLDELFRAILEELMSGRLSATPLIDDQACYHRRGGSAVTARPVGWPDAA
jgi:hypothetical protein